ncbi:hypothetical protein V8E36_006863 [Tilletia maclaganii]
MLSVGLAIVVLVFVIDTAAEDRRLPLSSAAVASLDSDVLTTCKSLEGAMGEDSIVSLSLALPMLVSACWRSTSIELLEDLLPKSSQLALSGLVHLLQVHQRGIVADVVERERRSAAHEGGGLLDGRGGGDEVVYEVLAQGELRSSIMGVGDGELLVDTGLGEGHELGGSGAVEEGRHC